MYCQKFKNLGFLLVFLILKDKDWRYVDGIFFKKYIVVCVREDYEVFSQGEFEVRNIFVVINRKKKEQFVLVGCLVIGYDF